MMVGGIRYEMVPLPDSMMDTTLFVGNFDEFVHVSLTLRGNNEKQGDFFSPMLRFTFAFYNKSP